MMEKRIRCWYCAEKQEEALINMGLCPSDYCTKMRIKRWKYLRRKKGKLQTADVDGPKLFLVK